MKNMLEDDNNQQQQQQEKIDIDNKMLNNNNNDKQQSTNDDVNIKSKINSTSTSRSESRSRSRSTTTNRTSSTSRSSSSTTTTTSESTRSRSSDDDQSRRSSSRSRSRSISRKSRSRSPYYRSSSSRHYNNNRHYNDYRSSSNYYRYYKSSSYNHHNHPHQQRYSSNHYKSSSSSSNYKNYYKRRSISPQNRYKSSSSSSYNRYRSGGDRYYNNNSNKYSLNHYNKRNSVSPPPPPPPPPTTTLPSTSPTNSKTRSIFSTNYSSPYKQQRSNNTSSSFNDNNNNNNNDNSSSSQQRYNKHRSRSKTKSPNKTNNDSIDPPDNVKRIKFDQQMTIEDCCIKESKLFTPLNQCNEVTSSTIKQQVDDVIQQQQQPEAQEQKVLELNEEKLCEPVNQILNEEKQALNEPINEIQSSSQVEQANNNNNSSENEQSRQQQHQHRHHHHHHKHHHHSGDHKKSKKSKKNDLRRSERIKTIVTKKQHEKELEIAEKIKKHHHHHHIKKHNHDNENNQQQQSPPESIGSTDKRSNSLSDNSGTYNLDTLSPLPTSSSIPASSIHQQPLTQATNSQSPPISFKKRLLNKAFNEVTSNDVALLTGLHPLSQQQTPFGGDSSDEWLSRFDLIDENIYFFKHKRTKCNKETKRMLCDCTTSEQEREMGIAACGDECLNRMLMIECGSRCLCDAYCTNKRFQRKQYCKITPFKTEFKGFGLRALEDIKPGTFVIEYIGEVIGLKEFKKRCEKYSKNKFEHSYFMELRNDQIIDATKKGNVARFFNHSCEPNCETQKWTVNGELRIGFFARKQICADDELTFDYQYQTFGEKQQKCYCGAEKCRGYLGSTSSNGTNNCLDQLWNSESDDSEDEDEDDEDSSDSDNEVKKSSKKRHNSSKHSKKVFKYKTDDHDLGNQILTIRSLSNKDSVLKLCRLMIRAESIENRISILDVLLNTKQDTCLRLFIDYHGLKLLWSWMVDVDRNFDTQYNELKLKLIDVLALLPVKNRTILEECKLYSTVKSWSTRSYEDKLPKIQITNPTDNEADDKKWVSSLVCGLADSIVERSNNPLKQLDVKCKELFVRWSELQQAFRIPKKQRIEERKEHERELNTNKQQQQTPTQVQQHSPTSLFLSKHHEKNEKYKEKGLKIIDRKGGSFANNSLNATTINDDNNEPAAQQQQQPYQRKPFNHKNSYYHSNSGNNINFNFSNNSNEPKLSKEERRQLFEQKVKESELQQQMLQQQLEQQEMLQQQLQQQQQNGTFGPIQNHATSTLPFETHLTPTNENNFKVMYDAQIGQWVQLYCPPPPPPPVPSLPVSLPIPSMGIPIHNLYNIPPPPPPPLPQVQQSSTLTQSIHHYLPHAAQVIDEQLFNSVKEALNYQHIQQLQINQQQQQQLKDDDVPPPPPSPPDKDDQQKLPKHWKCAKNDQGRTYYYHTITKKSQWHFPNDHSFSSPAAPASPSPTLTTTTTTTTTISIADTSSDQYKKRKEELREKLSKFVIKLLQPYLKEDCKIGRITNTDDFKHLARKFTHAVMDKELSRATKLDDIDLNKRIKIKAQEYITKYMLKYNGAYNRTTKLDP